MATLDINTSGLLFKADYDRVVRKLVPKLAQAKTTTMSKEDWNQVEIGLLNYGILSEKHATSLKFMGVEYALKTKHNWSGEDVTISVTISVISDEDDNWNFVEKRSGVAWR